MGQSLWAELSFEEDQKMRAWARSTWKEGEPIDPTWHPAVRDEIQRMRIENMESREKIILMEIQRANSGIHETRTDLTALTDRVEGKDFALHVKANNIRTASLKEDKRQEKRLDRHRKELLELRGKLAKMGKFMGQEYVRMWAKENDGGIHSSSPTEPMWNGRPISDMTSIHLLNLLSIPYRNRAPIEDIIRELERRVRNGASLI